ncbi:MAG: hypothetical protein ACE5HX_16805 [bacterium]
MRTKIDVVWVFLIAILLLGFMLTACSSTKKISFAKEAKSWYDEENQQVVLMLTYDCGEPPLPPCPSPGDTLKFKSVGFLTEQVDAQTIQLKLSPAKWKKPITRK